MTKKFASGMVTPSAGLASNMSDLLRSQQQAKVLNNVRQLRMGVFSSGRSGWQRQRNGAFNSGASFLDFGVFSDVGGNQTLLFQVGNTLYSYDLGSNTETAITGMTALSTSALPCMRMFAPTASGAPIMVYCNGAQELKQVTSVTAASALNINGASPGSTSAPLPAKTYSKPQFCEAFLNRMVYSGWQGSNTDTSRDVVITNSGTPGTVTQSTPIVATDGGVFTLPGSLGAPTGMKVFRVSNQTNDQILIIGCQNGIAFVTGSDATNFQMRVLTEEFGLLSNRAMVVVQNDVYMLATDGIRRFSGIAEGNTLLTAAMTRQQQDIIQTINNPQAAQAFACHHRLTQEIEFWFPANAGTTNNTALVMNYNTQSTALEDIEPIWYTRNGTTVACMVDFNNVQYGGSYNGLLQLHNQAGSLYDTTPVPWEITCAFISPGDSLMEFQVDQLLGITEGAGQFAVLNAFAYEDMGGNAAIARNQVMTNVPLGAAQPPSTILGSWILSVSGFPSNFVKLLEARPPGRMRYLELQLLGNISTHNIDFVGWEYRITPGEARP